MTTAEPTTTASSTSAPASTTSNASSATSHTAASPAAATSGSAATAGTGATAAGPADWTTGLPEETRGWVQLKGFKDPGAVVDSYRNLERMQGVPANRLMKLPENLDDATAMGEIYGRLGRPEKPEGYGIKAPEGESGEFADWASKNFFEAGLSAKQGQTLMQKFGEFTAAAQKAQADAQTAKTVEGQAALKKEWGMAHDQNLKVASRGARLAGVDTDTIDAIERAIGYEKTMKLFHGFGAKTGEDAFVSGAGNTFSAMTPAMAKARIADLRSDSGFTAKYLSGDAASRAEMERLHRMAFPEET